MAQCKNCNKKGLFFKVDRFKLCKDCRNLIQDYIDKLKSDAYEGEAFIKRCKKIDDMITTFERIEKIINKLIEYENLFGLPIKMGCWPPMIWLKACQHTRDEVIINHVFYKVQQMFDKAQSMKTKNGQLNNAKKALDFIQKYKSKCILSKPEDVKCWAGENVEEKNLPIWKKQLDEWELELQDFINNRL